MIAQRHLLYVFATEYLFEMQCGNDQRDLLWEVLGTSTIAYCESASADAQ